MVDLERIYVKQILKNNLISEEKEIEVAKKVKEGDILAKKELIDSNVRFAYHYAMKFCAGRPNRNEFIQSANLGMTLSADGFDFKKGRFTTHSSYRMWRELRNYVVTDTQFRPQPKVEKYFQAVHKAYDKFTAEEGELDKVFFIEHLKNNGSDISDNLNESEILYLLDRNKYFPKLRSTDISDVIDRGELLTDHSSELLNGTVDNLILFSNGCNSLNYISDIVKKMSDDDVQDCAYDLFIDRLENGFTFQELSEKYDISRQVASDTYKRIINKTRIHIKQKDSEFYDSMKKELFEKKRKNK